jgi:hypothetical protein
LLSHAWRYHFLQLARRAGGAHRRKARARIDLRVARHVCGCGEPARQHGQAQDLMDGHLPQGHPPHRRHVLGARAMERAHPAHARVVHLRVCVGHADKDGLRLVIG